MYALVVEGSGLVAAVLVSVVQEEVEEGVEEVKKAALR